jgi:hypothetical protein
VAVSSCLCHVPPVGPKTTLLHWIDLRFFFVSIFFIHTVTPIKRTVQSDCTLLQSEFVLTNRRWRHETKKDWARIKRLKLDVRMNLQPAIDRLATTAPSCSMIHEEYLAYTTVKLETMDVFGAVSRLRAPRRWKLETYQAEQRAAEKLCSDVQTGMSPDFPTGRRKSRSSVYKNLDNHIEASGACEIQCTLAAYHGIMPTIGHGFLLA